MMCSPPRLAISSRGESSGDHSAVVDDRHAVAQPLGFVHVVRRQQHGAAGGANLANDLPQLPPRLRIEPRRRLVEEQQLRIADQRAGHGQPLLLPARELADPRVGFFFQRDARHALRSGRAPRDRSCETASAFPARSAFPTAASLAARCRSAGESRRPPPPAQPQHLDLAGGRRAAALRESRSWSSCPPRSAPAGRSTRRARTSRSSPRTASTGGRPS